MSPSNVPNLVQRKSRGTTVLVRCEKYLEWLVCRVLSGLQGRNLPANAFVVAKSIFWQAAQQYHTILQREQRNNDDGDGDDAVASTTVLRSIAQALQNGCSRNGPYVPS